MTIDTTLPQLLRRNATTLAAGTAMREKDRGIWQPYSWPRYWDETRDFALGLAAAGFAAGDKLSVIGENRPRLYFAQLAAMCLGGVAVPAYQDAIASELAYVLDHAEVSVIVAEDQEQVDKALSVRDRLPHLKLIVYDDPRGLGDYDEPMLKSFGEIAEAGRQFGAAHPGYVEAAVEAGKPGDLCLFSYTSGTTSRPKGVMLSHVNLLAASEALAKADDVRQRDEHIAYLPMAWIGNSLLSMALHLWIGFTCNYPEKPETLLRDLRELGPTIALAPPRFWENTLTAVLVRANDASRAKRCLFNFFRGIAERAEMRRSAGESVPLSLRLGAALGEVLIYGPLRDQLGLRRARWAYTGGAPLGADTFRFFRAAGINLKQVYGATELAGLCSVQADHEVDPDTVGRAFDGTELRIGENGEVQVRSASVFHGYYKQEDATRGTMTEDGWLRTGDAGFIDRRGHLVIIDRARDVGKLADGTAYAPQFIENKLKFSPFVGEAVAFGDGHAFVAAIVAIDPTTVGNWAERQNLAYTSFQDLCAKPEVAGLVREEIRKCNAMLPEAVQIRRFLVLNKEFDADDDEITRTRKIRRGFVAEKYASVVEALYGGRDMVELATEITYEDGRKAMMRATLAITDVDDAPAPVELVAAQ
ncbi:MAG TPA: AMP-binding protein [Stellaceae bacterium]|jgi:long-chain acyl-CoA synthetase|nr:AMP-binding protein [Stellaceae bacterium]